MPIFRYLMVLGCTLSGLSQTLASASHPHFSRNFWYPSYHIERLSYCTLDKKECGMSLANRYCKLMGYQRASKEIIDYNVGVTNHLFSSTQCKGWGCNGFKLITCMGEFSRHPTSDYYYREHRFAFPRINHYRVDWCYDNQRGCGHRAAYSFCRQMGYTHARDYKKQEHVTATKALGNYRLCFGPQCSGFSEITCYR